LIEAWGAVEREGIAAALFPEKLMRGRFPSNTKNRTIMLTHRFIDKPL